MSDAVTETPVLETPAQETPAPTQTLPEQLREKLAAAVAPLTLKELAKELTRPKKVKPDEFLNSLPGYLQEDLQSGRVFKTTSGKAGLERYWNRDEKNAIQEAVQSAAVDPKKLGELKKIATGLTKADKAFAEGIVDEMIAAKELHEHSKKGPLYGRDEPIDPNNKEKVTAAILAKAETPTKLADLIKTAQAQTKADKEFVTSVANEMVAAKQLHEHSKKGPLYGHVPPIDPNNKEKVTAALLAAARTPAKLADLIKAALAETKADKKFVEATANELIEAKRLHNQGTGKPALYGLEEPNPLAVGNGKKEFDKLVKAADKLLKVVTGVSIEDFLTSLRKSLTAEAAKPAPEIKITEPAAKLVGGDTEKSHPAPVSHALTPERIRKELKVAYDDLCLDPEFEDKLVELRRLYHDAVKLMPGLTVPQFHSELKHLQSQRAIELQALNEVQRAKEPELAIHHNDRLLYYVIWR